MSELELLKAAVLRMHLAAEAYGSGYYNQDDWLAAYYESARLVGLEGYEEVMTGLSVPQ